jgi:5-oxoprolinase (ATP-hydrolysing)
MTEKKLIKTHADKKPWQIWIDRGGTFTDLVARTPDNELVSHKLLSENPEQYEDAALQGIRDLVGIKKNEPIPVGLVEVVKMGTTVATNALLERKGDRVVLITTKGFADALRIGYQHRPDIFAREIILPEMLYEKVIEVDERIKADGEVLKAPNIESVKVELQEAFNGGIRSVAIVFMHGYRYTDHEQIFAKLAKKIGYTQISISHNVSPLMKFVSRGDTTVVDAYLSPILRRYVDRVAKDLAPDQSTGTRLQFMQSNGGLTDAKLFQGKDSILSGPAGGVVGMVQTAAMAGYDKVIGFDMGGTSTDVSHYDGEYERAFETVVAGVRMRAPMMHIHTVAAGGGSILHFDGARFRVGPDSAGADPGPACYRRGGPLAVTDCNVMMGAIQPKYFPSVFGPNADQPLDAKIVTEKFIAMAKYIKTSTGEDKTPQEVAAGFRMIAVENMANAIKKISVQRGYDVTEYTLNCFGGAGGQHACAVADSLAINRVFVHPFAGVLSAYGMGLADVRALREKSIEAPLDENILTKLQSVISDLSKDGVKEVLNQGIQPGSISVLKRVHLRYTGSDTAIIVDHGELQQMKNAFEVIHRQRFAFNTPERGYVVEAVSIESVGASEPPIEKKLDIIASHEAVIMDTIPIYLGSKWQDSPIYTRENLFPGHKISGPAVIIEATGTTVVEPGWQAEISSLAHLILNRIEVREDRQAIGTQADPVMLEIFNNLFMSIAEQMGATLENTAFSVNIKERLDFSCAVFDSNGDLIANAPHMPVHLGSMGESIRAVINGNKRTIKPGNVYILNAPYNGGTHLPDVTVVTPVFDEAEKHILFYVGSRGHHADIGGTTPGSMPPDSRTVEEEGVLIDNFLMIEEGHIREEELRELLTSGPYPTRNFHQNFADLSAQVAANEKGVSELMKMIEHFGLEVVQAYMSHVQDNAEESVRRVLDVLKPGSFEYPMDCGTTIKVKISIDREQRQATIDFTGTSAQMATNFNAPSAVCRAAVLYVFRTLVDDDIPMNEGCMKPLNLIIPDGCMLKPEYPAAVVAGNVETSQCVTGALYGALGVMSSSQGTMNNFTFGNDVYQYYETICGGSGAGPGFNGTDAVHVHMTNSRLTDPEILEWRFPVLLEEFKIRRGSGGKGKYRGGDGTTRRVRFLEPMTATILSGHRTIPPYGLEGGESGAVGKTTVERTNGTEQELGATDSTDMNAGDVFVIQTPSGGGFGSA